VDLQPDPGGFAFGNIPWVKENLDKIIWAAILLPGLLVLIGAWRSRRTAAREDAAGTPAEARSEGGRAR
jgi:hypothetical protein